MGDGYAEAYGPSGVVWPMSKSRSPNVGKQLPAHSRMAAHKHGCNLSQPQMRVHARTGAHPRRAHVQSFARRYEATLWAAVSNAAAGGSRIVLLTLLGGGVFGSSFANRRR